MNSGGNLPLSISSGRKQTSWLFTVTEELNSWLLRTNPATKKWRWNLNSGLPFRSLVQCSIKPSQSHRFPILPLHQHCYQMDQAVIILFCLYTICMSYDVVHSHDSIALLWWFLLFIVLFSVHSSCLDGLPDECFLYSHCKCATSCAVCQVYHWLNCLWQLLCVRLRICNNLYDTINNFLSFNSFFNFLQQVFLIQCF